MHIIQLYHPVILYHTISALVFIGFLFLEFHLRYLTCNTDTRSGSASHQVQSSTRKTSHLGLTMAVSATGHYEFQGSPGSPGSPHSNGLFLFCQSRSPQEGTQTQSRDAWPSHTVPQNSTKRLFSLDSAAHHPHPSKLNKSEQVTFWGKSTHNQPIDIIDSDYTIVIYPDLWWLIVVNNTVLLFTQVSWRCPNHRSHRPPWPGLANPLPQSAQVASKPWERAENYWEHPVSQTVWVLHTHIMYNVTILYIYIYIIITIIITIIFIVIIINHFYYYYYYYYN